jgi:hypothetical protein
MSDLVPPMMPEDLDALIQAMERVQQLEAEVAKLRLTDAEREAIDRLCEAVAEYSDIDRKANGCHADDDMAAVAVARGILKRTQPVGPASAERHGATRVTDVGGAGPT